MAKNKECVIVKYRNGETKKISKGDMKKAHTIDENISFFKKASFNTDYQQSIFLIDSNSISEVVFQDFNFTDSPFQNFRLATSKGTTVVFDHCQIDNFKSYDEDDLPSRKGTLIFNDCSARSLFVTADRVVMRGNTTVEFQTTVDANNVFIEDNVDTERLSICSEVIYIDDANLRLSSIHVDTQSLAFSDSTLLATNINLKYKNLFTYHSSFTSPKYQFNGDTWSFGEKIKISSDDVICDVDFARVRFLKSLKEYQEKVNDCYSDVVKTSLDEVDQDVDLEIQEYQKQIDALEVKKIEANRGRSSLKQEKFRVLSNKKALGFLSSR